MVTQYTDDPAGNFSISEPYDLQSWANLPIRQIANRHVITSQSLADTEFEFLLGVDNSLAIENGVIPERGVDYVALIPMLADSMKQLVAINTQREEQIEVLKTRVAELEDLANQIRDID